MFRTKPISSNVVATPKPSKLDVLINVVAIITTHNQQLEQKVLKERESIKAKGVEDWQ
jgi:hypothetical protein